MAKLTQEEDLLLKQANLIWQMSETEGYQLVFKPFLQDKLNQSFPNPEEFKKEEEFLYAAKVTSVFKKVMAEILEWVNQRIEEAKALEAKKKDKSEDGFAIGDTRLK